MPYRYSLEDGEKLLASFSFSPSRKSEPVCLVVTTKAIFLPRRKFFAVKDARYLEKVPLSHVTRIVIKRIPSAAAWLLALPMIAAGIVLTAIMFSPLMHGYKGELSGYPPALALCGFVVPFVARKRFSLRIELIDSTFGWTPPILVDKSSRTATLEFFGDLANAFRDAGVQVIDQRETAAGDARGTTNLRAYPLAGRTDDPRVGIIRACCRCGRPLKLSRWDDLNGFLLRCPHCGGLHGKPWNVQRIALASLFFNAASFFFTMRRKRALPLALAFGLGFFVADRLDKRSALPESILMVIYAVLLLGPLLINATIALRQEITLGTAKERSRIPRRN